MPDDIPLPHLVTPSFDDPLTSMVIALDRERHRILQGTTPPFLFFQLKGVFHLMESLGSARIEGNRTTIAQLADAQTPDAVPELGFAPTQDSQLAEIRNIELAMAFIEETYQSGGAKDLPVTHVFIRELHRRVCEGLPADGEGDRTPGAYRTVEVKINRAKHVPPPANSVGGHMDDMLRFLNEPCKPQYELIKTALAHHRFAWIHPFANGNGRTARLFTYALLLRHGFTMGNDVQRPAWRILNPTAVFCVDRDEYYRQLSLADSLEDEALLGWCRYVLGGLITELGKIDRLLDYDHLASTILRPAIRELSRRAILGPHEETILLKAVDQHIIKKSDLAGRVKVSDVHLTRLITDLRDRHYLIPAQEGGRTYSLGFTRNPLLREVLRKLDAGGYLPFKGEA
jgi:Fic family protein